MSYKQVDRLPDDFWTENELAEMADLVINPSRTDCTNKHLCWYHLLNSDGEYTGKAMLLAVESIVDGQDAVNNAVANIGLTCAIGEYGDESVLNGVKVEAIYRALDKHQYIGKAKFNGCDKVFNYANWMVNIL